jgi:N-sulfoglucosamine sulfohydrolase
MILRLACLLATLVAVADKRPNIVFAFADDWGRHAGIYGQLEPGGVNDVVRTPHFDALAKRGVLFNNAHVNAPSCTPCRSSLLSGQYFWRTGKGAILQGAQWDSRIPAWPLLLDKGGYHIGKSYKVWSPGTPRDAPFGGGKFGYEKAGGSFNGFSQTVSKMTSNGKPIDEAKAIPLDQVRKNFAAFLAARPADSPFCYWFGPTNVHRKWIKGSGKKLWGIDPDSLKGKMPPFLPDVPEIREDLADYFGEIAAFDAALGVLIDALRQRGEFDNTIIVISGDHGAPGFPHGKCNLYDFGTRVPLLIAGPGIPGNRVVDDFTILPDLAPTFLEAGRQAIPEVMTARSLWPVLSSQKSGLVDPSRTAAFTGRERHVEKARAGQIFYPQRAIRTAEHLFIINFKPHRWPLGDPFRLDGDNPPTVQELTNSTFCTLPDEDAGPTKAWLVSNRNHPKWKAAFEHAYGKRPREELYDIAKDPHQMHNVAAEPAYAEIANRLRSRLMAELSKSKDPRLVDDGAYFEAIAPETP